MAEGTLAPNYRLSQGTQRRVQEAGLGGDARKHLQNAAMADELGNIATDVTDQIIEKQEDTAAREEAWDVGFDAMEDKGSWASGALFDQFQESENSFKDEYLEAVRKGDKKGQQRMLKDQATRSSGLQGWKDTMETAKQIHDGVGWSQSFLGPANEENREIIKALTKLDGKTAISRFGEEGEMVFDIKLKNGKTRTMTRREVDDMLAKGVKPLKQERDYMATIQTNMELGAAGKPFNRNSTRRNNEINITDDMIPALIREDFGGGGTFAEHIKSHPDMIAQFADAMGNGDGEITEEETAKMKTLIDEDMNTIIDAMEQNPDIARGYLAEWQTAQQEVAWEQGRAGREAKTTNKGGGGDVNKTIQAWEWKKKQEAIEEQKRIERYEALRKPIVIDGEPIGSLSQYSKSDGEWMVSPDPGDPNNKMKVKDYINTRSMGLPGAGDTPYEPLTKRASTKLYNEIISMLEGEAGPSGLLGGGSGTMEFD